MKKIKLASYECPYKSGLMIDVDSVSNNNNIFNLKYGVVYLTLEGVKEDKSFYDTMTDAMDEEIERVGLELNRANDFKTSDIAIDRLRCLSKAFKAVAMKMESKEGK